MLIKFNKKSNHYIEGSLGLVLHDAHTSMPLVRGATKYTHRSMSQDFWSSKATFSKVQSTKANLRAFDKLIKKLPRASSNCKPSSL